MAAASGAGELLSTSEADGALAVRTFSWAGLGAPGCCEGPSIE